MIFPGFSFLQYNLHTLNSGMSFSSPCLLQLEMFPFHFVPRSFYQVE